MKLENGTGDDGEQSGQAKANAIKELVELLQSGLALDGLLKAVNDIHPDEGEGEQDH